MDSSALIALLLSDDEFHFLAEKTLSSLSNQTRFITTNFILDESYTFIRYRGGKNRALDCASFLKENAKIIKIKRVTLKIEKAAFDLFSKLDLKDLSFTDCTSFAVMESLKLKEAFTFDRHFSQAGFHPLP